MPPVETNTRAFACPSKYIQGRGELDFLPQYTAQFAPKAFMLIDAFLYEDIDQKLRHKYDTSDVQYVSEKFGGECSYDEVERGVALIKKLEAGVVVGIGGGKTLDAAKAMANELQLPIIIVPTSASSDAPTSAMSVMYTNSGEYIKNIRHARNPEIVLVDTEIIAKAPIRLFVAGMGDALSTYFEATANQNSDMANYVGKGYKRCRAALALSELSFKLLMEEGERALIALQAGVCTESVENIIEANTLLSGVGFENSGCAAAHGIHSGLTELPETKPFLHGEKVAFGVICQMVMENTPKELFDQVIKFCWTVGLPITLSDLGVKATPEKVMVIAKKMVEGNTLVYSEPFRITLESVYDAIMAANALGEAFKKHMQ